MLSIQNGKAFFTSEFSAYTKLTLVNRFKNQQEGLPNSSQASMSFQEFSEALKSTAPVDSGNVRDLPQREQRDSDINIRMGGNAAQQLERLSFIQRAYQLGIVDENGVLVSRPQSNSDMQRQTMIQAYESSF